MKTPSPSTSKHTTARKHNRTSSQTRYSTKIDLHSNELDSSTYDHLLNQDYLKSKHFILTDDPNEPIKIIQTPTTSVHEVHQEILKTPPSSTKYKSVEKPLPKLSPKPQRPTASSRNLNRTLSYKWILFVLCSCLITILLSMMYRSFTKPFCDSLVFNDRKFIYK